jgi:proteasome lid subunit RPN8/RPN11
MSDLNGSTDDMLDNDDKNVKLGVPEEQSKVTSEGSHEPNHEKTKSDEEMIPKEEQGDLQDDKESESTGAGDSADKPSTAGSIIITEDTSQGDDDSGDDDIIGGSSNVGRKSMTGQTCTLKTLIDDKVITPGDGMLSMEYMGQKFVGDLLPNGHIRWATTKQVFSTPSSWVNHSKKMVNPDNSGKAGSAWSTIRYKGKRLDSYKLRWYRRQKKVVSAAGALDVKDGNTSGVTQIMSGAITPSSIFTSQMQGNRLSTEDPVELRKMNVVEHSTLFPRNSGQQDLSVMVKTVTFASIERIQPFSMTISTNALLLIDFHCHLTSGEVTGYLAGSWDFPSHILSVVQAFPCRSRLGDKKRSLVVEEEIKQNLEQRNLSVVGWYHSHPVTPPHPSVKDIESQLDYQISLKGDNESSYLPCVGLICSPYDASNESPESSYQSFWVMPPPEYRPYEYGRPMQMMFSVTRDSFLTQDLLLEMVS